MNSKDGWNTQQAKKRIVRNEVRAVMGKKQKSQKSGQGHAQTIMELN